MRRYVSGILNDYGFRVIEVSNALDAAAAFTSIQEEVDLILTDVVMPGISSGYEFVPNRFTPLVPANLFSEYYSCQVTKKR